MEDPPAPVHTPAPASSGARVTRLAPSPTGQLHLGNARTLLMTWAMARRMGWTVLLRIEDLDPSRTREGDVARCIEDLLWLGVDWDGEPSIQSERTHVHRAALDALARQGAIYRSAHSRAEVRRAAPETDALHAPHGMASVVRFPPELRPSRPGPDWIREAPQVPGHGTEHLPASANLRLALEPGVEHPDERAATPLAADPQSLFGDPILWTKAGLPAYHLAVCADDIAQGVTDVVRGNDLSEAAALHVRIWRLLGAAPPRWWHLPLLMDTEGQRMAKRHGSLTVSSLREAGADPARIAGFCAWSAGLHDGDLRALPAGALVHHVSEQSITRWTRTETGSSGHMRSRLSASAIQWLAR